MEHDTILKRHWWRTAPIPSWAVAGCWKWTMAGAPDGGRDAGIHRLGVPVDGTLGDPNTDGFIDPDLAMM